MKKIGRRKIIAATGILGAAVAIGVPAAIVYTTKDVVTKADIGKNVEKEIEDEVLNSLKLMPVNNQSGTFDSNRIQKYQEKLISLKEKEAKLEKEFSVRVMARIPFYGIINDVLTASQRFDKWDDFVARVNKTIGALNDPNFKGLGESLFDESGNGEHRLLSKSYGIDRSDVKIDSLDIADGVVSTGNVKQETERMNYGIQNTFTSFGEYVDQLENNSKLDVTIKDGYIDTIVSVLNMMTGTPIEMNSGNFKLPDIISNKPLNSIVYMAINLSDPLSTDDAHLLGSVWNEHIIGVWSKRYRAIDQFFNADHNPIGDGGKFVDTGDRDTFDVYKQVYAKNNPSKTIADNIESFLSGDKLQGTDHKGLTDGEWTGTTHRFLTNLEFLGALLGNSFDAAASTFKGGSLQSSKVRSGSGWDNAISSYAGVRITEGSGSSKVADYFNKAIANIFMGTQTKMSKFVKRPKSSDPSKLENVTEKVGLLGTLAEDPDFLNAYNAMETAKETYVRQTNSIQNDSFRVGIKIDEFKQIISSFKLEKNWKIQIDSLIDKAIDINSIEDISSKIKTNKDGSLVVSTDDYVIDDGYVYPTADEWLLRSSDSVSIRNLKFKDGAKLDQFENFLSEIRVFKPHLVIDQDKTKTTVKVSWNLVNTEYKGGSND